MYWIYLIKKEKELNYPTETNYTVLHRDPKYHDFSKRIER